jgi:ClpP class serine protease
MNFADLLEKWGVKETSIASEGSKFKNAESSFKPETPETTAYLRTIADDMYQQFAKSFTTGAAARSSRSRKPPTARPTRLPTRSA